MNAKEQAGELVEQFARLSEKFNQGTDWEYDKQCALLSVQELITQAGNQRFGNHLAMQYWLDVEREIKEL